MPSSTCEKCHKGHATYHLTAIENGAKKEAHLCEACAKSSGIGFKFNFSVGDLLGGFEKPSIKPKKGKGRNKKCPECGMTAKAFQEKGRFGCANDYDLFKREIQSLLPRIHGSDQHVGKTPDRESPAVKDEIAEAKKKADLDKRIKNLKDELERVVKTEDYERAAQLRDQIKGLETDA